MWSRNCLPFQSILFHPCYCHWVRIARILVFCVVLCRSHFSYLYSFGHCIVCSSSEFWNLFFCVLCCFFSFVLFIYFFYFCFIYFFSALFLFCSVCVLYRMPLDCLFLTAISVFSDVYIQCCSSSHMSS
jgi:hypothetical protein